MNEEKKGKKKKIGEKKINQEDTDPWLPGWRRCRAYRKQFYHVHLRRWGWFGHPGPMSLPSHYSSQRKLCHRLRRSLPPMFGPLLDSCVSKHIVERCNQLILNKKRKKKGREFSFKFYFFAKKIIFSYQ